jgi:hypothetical protein
MMLTKEARRTLMDVARRTVRAAVTGNVTPIFEIDEPELQGEQGAFVTLGREGNCGDASAGSSPASRSGRSCATWPTPLRPRTRGSSAGN